MRIRFFKSQVSAPIELFVAVIILAMALGLGLKVIGDVEEGKCVATLKTQTQQLKNAMIDVALGSAGTTRTVYFDLPTCGNEKVDGLQFVLYLQPEYCRLCQGNYGYCWQVVPISRDPANRNRYSQVPDAISCVNMAGDVQIKECAGGIQLSNAPCFQEAGCNPTDFGVTTSVWREGDPTSPSRWKTLSGLDVRSFKIKLTKTTELAGGNERGSIEVCATAAD
ncbi:MAG: hypothetical protein QXR53_03345 [Candidatus Norongarragalinales archaeon]